MLNKKLSLTLLTGIILTVSACNLISKAPEPKPIQSPANVQTKREDYKAIDLANKAKPDQLIGADPKAIALSTFGQNQSLLIEGNFDQQVKVDYPQPDQAVVTITQTGLPDDSVRGIRYRIELSPKESAQTGKQWQVMWAGQQFTCREGRGHQDWSTEFCQ